MQLDTAWHPHNITSETRVEILDKNSMTAKMKSQCGEKFYLKLLRQEPSEITASEAKILHLKTNQKVMVREIEMGCANQPWLFGRTILTPELLKGESGKQLKNLGSKPLGEILFKDAMVRRSDFEIAKINKNTTEYNWIQSYKLQNEIIARRSIFYFYNKPLLLTEVFLNFPFS